MDNNNQVSRSINLLYHKCKKKAKKDIESKVPTKKIISLENAINLLSKSKLSRTKQENKILGHFLVEHFDYFKKLRESGEEQKLEKIMNENGIKISDYSLIDDILDYNVAKEMNTKIGTGLMGGMANIARRAAAQPVAEGVINAQNMLNPAVNQLQNVGRNIKPAQNILQSPALYSGLVVPTLQGGVVYNDYRK